MIEHDTWPYQGLESLSWEKILLIDNNKLVFVCNS